MLWRSQPETSTYAHESTGEDPVRILRNALMKATGGHIAFMRASTEICALMRALAKIRGKQNGAFSERSPNAILSKSRRAPGAPGAPGTTFFFLDAKLLNAQELRMTLVCSKANSLK